MLAVGDCVRIRRLPQRADRKRWQVGQVARVVVVHPVGTEEVEIRTPEYRERRIHTDFVDRITDDEYRTEVGGYLQSVRRGR